MTSGFSFGTNKTTAPPAFGTGSMTFIGANPQAPGTAPGSFQLGTSAVGATSVASLFGTPASAPKPTFGMPSGLGTTPTGPGLFGTQTASVAPTGAYSFSAPAATSTAAGGLQLGAAFTSAAPAFGLPAASTGSITAPTLGTGLTFGAQTSAAPTGGLTFGAQTSAAPTGGLTFGAPTSVAPTGGLTFGAQSSAAPTGGLTFGAQTSSAPTGGLTFGAQTSAAPTGGLTFGAPTSAAPSGGLTFGAQPISAAPTGLTFGALTSAPATGLTFGAVSTAAPTLGLSFTGASTAAPTLGGFGAFSIATTAPGALNFGLGSTAASSGGLSFGLGGTNVTSGVTQFNLTPVSTTPSLGLGGIASTQAKTTVTTQKEIPPKDQPLPNEILQSVEQFKHMLKEQKAHCSDIARCSVREFRKVEQEIDSLNNIINEVECQLQKNRHLAEKLKYDAARSLQNVEMAQRTHDTPPGLQYENTAPLKYFLDLADSFERQMQTIKAQIECADKYVKSNKSPDNLSPQDLSMGMRRLHEIFVALAGRLQAVHSQVESQKESYINLRKHLFNDHSDPFEKLSRRPEEQMNLSGLTSTFYLPPKIACGPTPFSHVAMGGMNSVLLQHNSPPPAYPGGSAGNQPTGQATASTSFRPPIINQPFGSTGFGSTTLNSSFQLQKPPTGNKRGKI